MIRTMTVPELTADLRKNGVKTSEAKVRAFILQGKYPFAIGVEMESQRCEIYTKLYEEWKKERSD